MNGNVKRAGRRFARIAPETRLPSGAGETTMWLNGKLAGRRAGLLAALWLGATAPLAVAQTTPQQDGVIEPPALNEPVPQQPPPALPDAAAPQVNVPPGLPSAPGGVPFSFADLAERLLGSVVNISTSQRVSVSRGVPMPRPPTLDEPDEPHADEPEADEPETPGEPGEREESERPPFEDFLEEFFDRQPGQPNAGPRRVQSLGSGFVIDPGGLIVTNNHVIAEADEIVANFADGSKLTAEVVGRDEKTDLALLKVTPPQPLAAVPFGDSDKLRVGEWVMAIGNPFGFGGSVTVGIVSALDRDINSGPYDRFIQTDASINRGNSGGPLFNLAGEVVGINTAIMSPTGGSIGIGFSVPADLAVPVIRQLQEFGETRRGWIGVRIQEVTDEIAESLGMERAMGALIAGVMEDGPAAKAGLTPGDVVLEFNGEEVGAMRQLPRVVADVAPGETVEIVVLRDGERTTLQIEIGLLEEDQVAAATSGGDSEEGAEAGPGLAATFGMTLAPITAEDRSRFDIGADVRGVLISEVEPGSVAEEKRLRPGEVIVEVGQQAVATPAEVTARLNQLKSDGRRSALFLVSGAQNELRFVSMRFEEGQ